MESQKTTSLKLAIIGNESSILLYRALGIETHPVSEASQAREKLQELASQNVGDESKTASYAVIFVEERYYKLLPADLLTRLSQKPLPAVVPVPSPDSDDPKFGLKRISKIVERAVGSDILS
jgi:V/A-type H+-transporting ATPase subunit F